MCHHQATASARWSSSSDSGCLSLCRSQPPLEIPRPPAAAAPPAPTPAPAAAAQSPTPGGCAEPPSAAAARTPLPLPPPLPLAPSAAAAAASSAADSASGWGLRTVTLWPSNVNLDGQTQPFPMAWGGLKVAMQTGSVGRERGWSGGGFKLSGSSQQSRTVQSGAFPETRSDRSAGRRGGQGKGWSGGGPLHRLVGCKGCKVWGLKNPRPALAKCAHSSQAMSANTEIGYEHRRACARNSHAIRKAASSSGRARCLLSPLVPAECSS